jgi:phenylacetate-CoA ligase
VIDPETLEPAPPGDAGELVITTLTKEALPMIRYRTRDITRLNHEPCACGRTHVRIMRVTGRSDDMLIVRGVNVFPSAVRDVVASFTPDVSGHVRVKPSADGVKQEPPLPVVVELAAGASANDSLADAIRERLRAVLVVQTRVELVPFGSLQRSEYKSQLIER